MNKTGYIYKITNPKGRIYIGQTIDIERRWDSYRNLYCKSQKILYNSLKKYTPELHHFEIIEEVTEKELDNREIYWVDFYKCNVSKYPEFKGMNLTDGGGGMRGYAFTEEDKKKRIVATTGRHLSEEHKKKLSTNSPKYWLGKHLSEETKRKVSEAKKGSVPWNKGKKGCYSMDTINKRRKTVIGMFKGGKNPMAKVVLNTENGIFYDCAKEAAEIYNTNPTTLRDYLRGKRKNKTSLIYV